MEDKDSGARVAEAPFGSDFLLLEMSGERGFSASGASGPQGSGAEGWRWAQEMMGIHQGNLPIPSSIQHWASYEVCPEPRALCASCTCRPGCQALGCIGGAAPAKLLTPHPRQGHSHLQRLLPATTGPSCPSRARPAPFTPMVSQGFLIAHYEAPKAKGEILGVSG